MKSRYVIEIAETSRIDGSLEGGFSVLCDSMEEVNSVISELEYDIENEVLSEDFPFKSLKWKVKEW